MSWEIFADFSKIIITMAASSAQNHAQWTIKIDDKKVIPIFENNPGTISLSKEFISKFEYRPISELKSHVFNSNIPNRHLRRLHEWLSNIEMSIKAKNRVDRLEDKFKESGKQSDANYTKLHAQLQELDKQVNQGVNTIKDRITTSDTHYGNCLTLVFDGIKQSTENYSRLETQQQESKKQVNNKIDIATVQIQEFNKQLAEQLDTLTIQMRESNKHFSEQLDIISIQMQESNKQLNEQVDKKIDSATVQIQEFNQQLIDYLDTANKQSNENYSKLDTRIHQLNDKVAAFMESSSLPTLNNASKGHTIDDDSFEHFEHMLILKGAIFPGETYYWTMTIKNTQYNILELTQKGIMINSKLRLILSKCSLAKLKKHIFRSTINLNIKCKLFKLVSEMDLAQKNKQQFDHSIEAICRHQYVIWQKLQQLSDNKIDKVIL